jgi:MoaA/NifB/PqqE/SkfB family radical SAM enzyme
MLPTPTYRAMVDVGRKCNASCIHCYYAQKKDSSVRSVSELKKEIDHAKSRGNNYVDFSGGEPTIHPDIAELVKYCGSIDMSCCIITNGLAGETVIDELIEAGVDDWLLSAHGGTETVNNEIMRVEGARKIQLRFLQQLSSCGKTFRINYCMIRHNQEDIVAMAKWAVETKPRILNFINFNPHHEWRQNLDATRDMIADLIVVEEQLCKAIPILTDAGIGVNVRYYPFCRLPEAFRMHICNDNQVLFDPYEWDYGIVPKNYKRYKKAAAELSNSIEWKGQPCIRCQEKFACGGINKAFFMASGLKGNVAPITTIINRRLDDVYHYRRTNEKVLIPRITPPEAKIRLVPVDEGNFAIVPLYLALWEQAFPDEYVVLLSDHAHHDEIRDIADRYIGYGLYDGCIESGETLADHIGKPENGLRSEKYYNALIDLWKTTCPFKAENITTVRLENVEAEIDCRPEFYDEVRALSMQTIDSCKIKMRGPAAKALPAPTPAPLPPAKIAEKKTPMAFTRHEGEFIIYTVIDEAYEWYIPLFLYSMAISHPGQKTIISIRRDTPIDARLKTLVEPFKLNTINFIDPNPRGGYFTAAMRFLIDPPTIADYTLITDVDILFKPENSPIIDQHLYHLEKDATECYENWISEYRGGKPRLPGIHFVTRAWWDRTRDARLEELETLKTKSSIEYFYDEMMIGRIVEKAGLLLPPAKAKLWRKHGRHLGDDRLNIERKFKARYDTFEKMHVKTLLEDRTFMALAQECASHLPFLEKVFKKWPILFI